MSFCSRIGLLETVSAAFDEIYIYQSSMAFLEFVYEVRLLHHLLSVKVYLLWQSYRIKKWPLANHLNCMFLL